MSEYTLYMATALLVTVFVFTSNQVFSPAGADEIAEHEPVQLSSIGLEAGNRRLKSLNK
jgi:hypothetical protein